MSTTLSNSAKAFFFYVLAVGLTTAVSLLYPLLGNVTMLLHMYTPTLASLLMLLVVTRDGYTKTSWQLLGFHRRGRGSWGLALVGPFVLLSAVYSSVWLGGVGNMAMPSGFSLADVPIEFIVGLLINATFALGEETGFRGYLLPQLMPLGKSRAFLLSGLLHALWHLPLMLLTPLFPIQGSWLVVGPIFVVTLTAAGVFYGYLQFTSGSIWPTTLAHGAVNQLLDMFMMFTVTTSPVLLTYLAGETGILTMGATVLFAGGLLYRLRQRRGTVAIHLPSGA